MLTVRATKKLRDRIGSPDLHDGERSTTALGEWYATRFAWRPDVLLLVNESTLLPVLLPLAGRYRAETCRRSDRRRHAHLRRGRGDASTLPVCGRPRRLTCVPIPPELVRLLRAILSCTARRTMVD
jgi:hypothetical protein